MKQNTQKINIIEKVIRSIAPMTAVRREQARLALKLIDGQRRFDGASKKDRFSEWSRPGTSADSSIVTNLPLLRNSARDLTRNNPWAEKALMVIENNTVGTGIVGQVIHKDEKKAAALQELYNKWTATTAIDATDRLDLVALESLIIRGVAESGELIIRRRYRRSNSGYPIPVQVQVLEPDYLDHGKDSALKNGGEIKNGIEYTKQGKPAAYWLYTEHPGEMRGYRSNIKSVRIPAADIIHVFDQKRSGQTRGYPWVASAIRRLKDFDDYEDAQLVRQKIAACFTGIIHDMNTQGGGATGLSLDKDKNSPQPEYLQPGMFETLPAGKDIKFPSPPGVQNYDEYTRNILRGVAASYGITYEAMTGDYSNVNFSSGRMGWIEMSRNVQRWQNSIMRAQVLDNLANWFFGGATLKGFDTEGARIEWTFPRREMIDPTKEVPAIIKQLRAGLTSLPRVHKSLGLDSDKIIEEIAASNAILDENSIILDSDPRRVNNAGTFNEQKDPDSMEDD